MLDVNRVNKKLTSLVALAVTALIVFAFGLIFAPTTSAQSEDTLEVTTTDVVVEETEAVAEETAVTHYRFVAEYCDSLTKLVRRAILIYDEVNDDIELTKEGIVYTETNIVQDMGAYWLEIGDVVEVPISKIEKYTNSSLDLTEAQVAAWAVYVPYVDFELADIQQPENREEVVQVIEESLKDDEPEVVTEEDNNSASTWWWFAGVGTAGIVWYLLWKREEN